MSPRRTETPQFSIPALLIATVVVAVFAAGVAALQRRDARQRAEEARVAKLNAEARAEILVDVNAICSRLGRLPEDERELVRLMARPMPEVQVGHRLVPIEYHRTGPGSFNLYHMEWTYADYFLYDSKAPQTGWTPVCD
jgi:hypothetical protein